MVLTGSKSAMRQKASFGTTQSAFTRVEEKGCTDFFTAVLQIQKPEDLLAGRVPPPPETKVCRLGSCFIYRLRKKLCCDPDELSPASSAATV